MRRVAVDRAMTIIGLLCLVGAVIAAWTAIGRLADNAERIVVETAASLETAKDVSISTAQLADRLQTSVDAVDDGLLSTSDAIASTRKVSASVREVIGFVSRFSGSVDDLIGNLEEAEASMQVVEGDLRSSSTILDQSRPQLAAAVANLQLVPARIDASIAKAELARRNIDDQVGWWRAAVLLAAAAMAVVLLRPRRQLPASPR